MPKGKKATKPNYNFINKDTVYNDVITAFNIAMYDLGFNDKGIDDSIPNKPRNISHNQVNYCLRQVARALFTPDKPLYNNQKSLVNYDDVELLQELASVFIDICYKLNKSLGLMSFGYMVNISYWSLCHWLNDETANPERSKVLKTIQEDHKAAQVSLLNDSPVGALAVANNDIETGLNWSQNQLQQLQNNTVFLIPSERVDRLKLDSPKE